MNDVCNTCGNAIEGETHACPACAIKSVLEGEWDFLPLPSELPLRHFSPLLSRLPIREDFFKRYQILEAIEDGGQGQVWKVWDYDFRRTLAMKGLDDKLATN